MAEPDWDTLFPAVGGAPSAPTFPGVIPGRPKAPPAPTPFQVEDQDWQRKEQARKDAEWTATHNADGSKKPEDPAAGKPTEYQAKSASFLGRMLEAEGQFGAVPAESRDARSGPGQWFHDTLPSVENYTNTPDRQKADQAARNFIAASLRQESGAAISPEEYRNQYRIFFPMPGDGADVTQQKAEARRQAIEGFKISAGPLAGQAVATVGSAPDGKKLGEAAGGLIAGALPAMGGDGSPTPPNGGETLRDANGNIIGPEFEGVAYDADGSPVNIEKVVGKSDPKPAVVDGNTPSVGKQLAAGLGDVIEGGFNNSLGIIVNPVGRTLYEASGYGGREYNGGQILRDTLGLPEGDARVSAITEAGTGALAMAGLAGAGANLATGATRGALSQFGATPIRDAAAGAGAGYGGDVGRRYGGIPGQIAGTLIGGVGGYAGANALAKAATGVRAPNALMQGADDLGVTMMPADVGGVGTRMATGGIGRTLGGIPIAEGAQKSISSAAKARTNIANDIGSVTDNVGAGQAAKRGFSQFERSSLKRGEELYENVSVPAEDKVQLGQTRTALADVTKGMQSNPELSRLWANHPRLRSTLEALTPQDVAVDGRQAFAEASDRLTKLQDQFEVARSAVPTDAKTIPNLRAEIDQARQDLLKAKELVDTPPQGGELSWQDMKRFRSIVGEIIGQPGIQRDGSDIGALRKLYGALTSDMEVTAAHAGPKALQEFRRANQYWRGREGRIDDVFAALLGKDGKRSDEAVFKQINSWAKSEGGDFSRIARTIRSMPDDEANTIRSTIIQRMGQAKPANQDATGEIFSPALFSTEWRGMSDRAKNVLFANKQHRQDLEKLAQVTDGMKRADQFQNFSNTSLGVNVTTQGALAYASLPAAVALAAMQFGAGKLLASPRFARILASSVKLPPEQAGRRIGEQLKVLATREPLIANDLNSVQQYLADQLVKSPGRAAADDSSDSRRKPPQQ